MNLFPWRKRTAASAKSVPVEEISSTPTGGHTQLSCNSFQILMPGIWKQVSNPDRAEFVDSTGAQQLMIAKLAIEGNASLSDLAVILKDFGQRKRKAIAQLSKGAASCSQDDVRQGKDQIELRFHGHDKSNQVGFTTVFRATPREVFDFTVYLYQLPQMDAKLHAGYQVVFDLLQLK
jgi:hypothetical protein